MKSWLIWLIISIVMEAVGDYLLKLQCPMRALLAYNGMLVAWLLIVGATKQITIPGTIWLLCGHLALIAVGVGIFHETMTMRHWVGVGLAFSSLCLLAQ